jgi:hypothetical protein
MPIKPIRIKSYEQVQKSGGSIYFHLNFRHNTGQHLRAKFQDF